MKNILLFIAIAAFGSANAQQTDLFDTEKYLQKKQDEKQDPFFQYKNLDLNKPFSTTPLSAFTLLNGDKVITLPSYNMPVIVPDMKQFQAMPNLATASSDASQFYFFNPGQPGVIPNGALPLTAPTVSSLELLNQLLKKK